MCSLLAGRVHCGSEPIGAFGCDPFLRLPRRLRPLPHYQPHQEPSCGVPPKVSGLMGETAEGTQPSLSVVTLIEQMQKDINDEYTIVCVE